MGTVKPGDVVIADFPGATGIKRRPAVVLSTVEYHNTHKDVILGAITTNLQIATTQNDHILSDWLSAGLRRPSAFRTFLVTLPQNNLLAIIGHLSQSDQFAVEECVRNAIIV